MSISSRVTVLKRGQIWLPGGIWQCLEILFGCYKLGRVLLACMQRVGVRIAANQPTWHRMAVHIKGYLTQNVSSTKAEKPWSKVLVNSPFLAILCGHI